MSGWIKLHRKFCEKAFLSRIEVEEKVKRSIPDAKNIVFTGFQRLTKEEFEHWHSEK